MQLPFYKALRKIGIDDATATELVTAMDAHIEQRVLSATNPLLARIDMMQVALSGQIDTLKTEKATERAAKDARIKNWQWAAGWAVGGLGTGVTAVLGIGKALGFF